MPATRRGRMRLFSGPLSMFGAKTEIAALEKGLDFELVMVPFEEKYDPKHPEVLRINPKQQVPILIHGDLEIFDSTQIFEYFEDLQPQPPLWPRGPAARAQARLLELKSDEVYFPHIIRLMGLQSSPQDPAAIAARHAAARYYEEIDGLLADREFLTRTYSFADIAFYMAQLFGARMGAPMTDATPNLLRWRDRMTARPAVRSVVGPMAAFLLSTGRPVPDFLSFVVPQRPAVAHRLLRVDAEDFSQREPLEPHLSLRACLSLNFCFRPHTGALGGRSPQKSPGISRHVRLQ